MATVPPFPSTGNSPTLAELLQQYEHTHVARLALTTRTHHAVVFRKLCGQYGDLPLTAITPAWLRQWREAISPGHALGTVRQYLMTLSGFLTWAVEHDYLGDNPMRSVRRPPEPPGRIRFLSGEEYHRLRDA